MVVVITLGHATRCASVGVVCGCVCAGVLVCDIADMCKYCVMMVTIFTSFRFIFVIHIHYLKLIVYDVMGNYVKDEKI